MTKRVLGVTPEFGNPAGIRLELFMTLVIVGPLGPPPPVPDSKVSYCSEIDPPLLAVTRSLEPFPPLVSTPMIVPTGSELDGMGAVEARNATACRIVRV